MTVVTRVTRSSGGSDGSSWPAKLLLEKLFWFMSSTAWESGGLDHFFFSQRFSLCAKSPLILCVSSNNFLGIGEKKKYFRAKVISRERESVYFLSAIIDPRAHHFP